MVYQQHYVCRSEKTTLCEKNQKIKFVEVISIFHCKRVSSSGKKYKPNKRIIQEKLQSVKLFQLSIYAVKFYEWEEHRYKALMYYDQHVQNIFVCLFILIALYCLCIVDCPFDSAFQSMGCVGGKSAVTFLGSILFRRTNSWKGFN